MDTKLLKLNAKNSLKKKHGDAIIVALIMSLTLPGTSVNTDDIENFDKTIMNISDEALGLIIIGIIALFIASFAFSIFVSSVFSVGGNRFFLKLRKNTATGINEVLGNFKDGNYKNIVKTTFFKDLEIMLFSLAFIIPGFIKAFKYFLVDYILAVRPDISYTTAFEMSEKLMDGHKMSAFKLGLSFIPWQILNLFTLGILGIVYIAPYQQATFAEFYAYVRSEGLKKGLITVADLPDYEPPFNPSFQQFSPYQPQPNNYQQNYYQPNNYPQNDYQYGSYQSGFDNTTNDR